MDGAGERTAVSRFDAPIDYPAQYREYFRLFNARDYFEAHEVLEDLWVMEPGPLRNYYKGLIMAAVALLHWQRGNPSGAFKLFRDGMRYLDAYPAKMEGFALGEFRARMREIFAPLAEGNLAAAAPSVEVHPVLSLDEPAR